MYGLFSGGPSLCHVWDNVQQKKNWNSERTICWETERGPDSRAKQAQRVSTDAKQIKVEYKTKYRHNGAVRLVVA